MPWKQEDQPQIYHDWIGEYHLTIEEVSGSFSEPRGWKWGVRRRRVPGGRMGGGPEFDITASGKCKKMQDAKAMAEAIGKALAEMDQKLVEQSGV